MSEEKLRQESLVTYHRDGYVGVITLNQSLDYNATRSSMILPSEDLLEAMSAYMQKRKGEFKGV